MHQRVKQKADLGAVERSTWQGANLSRGNPAAKPFEVLVQAAQGTIILKSVG